MRYLSTRSAAESVDFEAVLTRGLAPDGGLYIPGEVPRLPPEWSSWSYQEAVVGALELFGGSDVEDLVADAAARFTSPEIAPVVDVADRLVLELFWGPTLSFKDHALQVVGRLLDRSVVNGTILGATSGDTGSAAIEAVRGSEHLRIVILFPEGKVSEFQRRQMTTVTDNNVTALAVRGTFDDCQALVKDAFASHELLAVNSINFARIAAQIGFYIHAGARIADRFDVVVPTGNFGNVYSCWMAKQMGVPIQTITIANNANRGLHDLVTGGTQGSGEVRQTVAPSMDIGVPSNLERFSGEPDVEFQAGWSDDEEIIETISSVYESHGYLMDTHTATAWRAGGNTRSEHAQLVVSTAHPAKFPEALQRAVGFRPMVPEGFPNLYELPEHFDVIDPSPSALDPFIR
ncbi:MAG: threonine synthase [Acidimicrobiia bacterium]